MTHEEAIYLKILQNSPEAGQCQLFNKHGIRIDKKALFLKGVTFLVPPGKKGPTKTGAQPPVSQSDQCDSFMQATFQHSKTKG